MSRFPLARGRVWRRPSGSLNKTESRYADQLELRKLAGEVAWYGYESIKLKLTKATFYTPDFLVILADGTVELHEVKGFWEDDARVKIKVAAELFPMFRFIAITEQGKKFGGGWKVEEF